MVKMPKKALTDDEQVLESEREIRIHWAVNIVERRASQEGVPSAHRRQVADIVKRVQKADIKVDPGRSRAVERLVRQIMPNKNTKQIAHGVYSEWEYRQAMFSGLVGLCKIARLSQVYGVSSSTFYDHRKAHWEVLDIAHWPDAQRNAYLRHPNNRSTIRKVADTLPLPKLGRPGYLEHQVEADVIALSLNHRDTAGAGLDRNQVTAHLQQYMHHKAQFIESRIEPRALAEDPQYAKQRKLITTLQRAHCGRHFIKTNLLREGALTAGVAGPAATSASAAGKFGKTSAISQRRAKAASPLLADAMYSKFLNRQAGLIANKVFPAEGPSASQVLNADEVGCDPTGKIKSTFSFGKPRDERRFHTVTSEHAPWWASIVLTSCADGTLPVPPLIIHQGDEHFITGEMMMNLRPDIHVTVSKSGYCNGAAFRAWALAATNYYTGAAANLPKVLSLDGYDSHWDSQAMEHLMSHGYYINYTRANASIEDQPNDNGLNGLFAAKYSAELAAWRVGNVNVPITRGYFNLIVSRAWTQVLEDPTLAPKVKHSYEKTHMYPLSNPVTSTTPRTEEQTQRLASAAALSQPFCATQQEASGVRAVRQELHAASQRQQQSQQSTSTPSPDQQAAPTEFDDDVYDGDAPYNDDDGVYDGNMRYDDDDAYYGDEDICDAPDRGFPTTSPTTPSSPPALQHPPPEPPVSHVPEPVVLRAPGTHPAARPQDEMVALSMSVVQPGQPQYAVLLPLHALQFHEKSFVTPVQQIAAEMRDQKHARGVKVPNPASTCLNPDSSTGTCSSQELLVQCQRRDRDREEKQVTKQQTKLRVQDAAARARVSNKAAASQLMYAAYTGQKNWKAFNVPTLKAAYIHFRGKDLPQGRRLKADRVAALEPIVAERLEAIHSGQAQPPQPPPQVQPAALPILLAGDEEGSSSSDENSRWTGGEGEEDNGDSSAEDDMNSECGRSASEEEEEEEEGVSKEEDSESGGGVSPPYRYDFRYEVTSDTE
jgi:hypothetical protein